MSLHANAEYLLTRFPRGIRRLAELQPQSKQDPIPPGFTWLWLLITDIVSAETVSSTESIADALHTAINEWLAARHQALLEERESNHGEDAPWTS